MICCVECVDRGTIEMTMPLQPAQASLAQLHMHGQHVGTVQVTGGIRDGCAILVGAKHAISDEHMIVYPIVA